ncbi:hypothetical protein EJ05DRAFT_503624 [Pseudovirgaria hyperparasitica]|uniref:Cupin type-2 domain-containing protein n=1 Tax=Pseudovirgaria hyperparasitica TaxID=470096 RepID=A0A6A6VVR5_9PEZI|nr:uncharacterized protein EJ05DRAFT_503624 [Pseudovirgaria hyperparasitica]KAF2754672.1 hypothetical protein EJ05DRAFT_503624 [Pseudovirgaria hyperparasitica]
MVLDEEKAMRLKATPTVPVNYVAAKAGETFKLGQITIRIMEDGSRTDNRIGSAEFTVPAKTKGPPMHWHEMHDETFLVTQGTLRFNVLEDKVVDAATGDYVVVPPRAPHTFENPFDEDAKFFNTYTVQSLMKPPGGYALTSQPAYYINYFKLLATMAEDGKPMSKEANIEAMARYATLPVKQ